MATKPKRALWLINHTTLRKFEVPLLMDMGYEVYLPKSFPYDEGNLSASVDFSYDKTLTIPPDDLSVLNSINFYERIPGDAVKIINNYFDICFFSFFPVQMRELVRKFKGVLVFRPFGLGSAATYTTILMQLYGIAFFDEISKIHTRFFFGQSYENLCEVEPRFFQVRAVTLPLGLASATVNDKWKGLNDRILFVCPRIETSDYYYRQYKAFTDDFKGFKYIIGGAQPIPSTDPSVVGFLSDEEYEDMYVNSKLMFYHSTEKRHIHYHPFEAVKNGLPLLFMGGGMLDELGGASLPGRCKSISDARAKAKKIINGNARLINAIKNSQHTLLEKMSYNYCKPIWDKNIEQIEKQFSFCQNTKKKKIGILLGEAYTGGVLDYTIRLVTAVERGIRENKDNVEVVFGHVIHENFKDKYCFEKIAALNIEIRPFKWKKISWLEAREITALKYGEDFYRNNYKKEEYHIPDDAASYFSDCDYLVFSIDRSQHGLVFTTQPYAVCIHDYIQRYIPEMMGSSYEEDIIEMSRRADAIIANTTANYNDVIQYLGIPKNKIKMMPLLLEAYESKNVKINASDDTDAYFLWSTNIAAHKNHRQVLYGLSEYYQNGGFLNCCVTGVNTVQFDVSKPCENVTTYVREIRDIISSDENLTDKVIFKGNMSKSMYIDLLRNAKFFLHGGLIDNGNMSVVDAALLGVPSVSSWYHAMEYYNEYMKLGLRFFDPTDYKSLSDILLKTQQDWDAFRKTLPDRETLLKYTINHTYIDIYQVIKDVAQF